MSPLGIPEAYKSQREDTLDFIFEEGHTWEVPPEVSQKNSAHPCHPWSRLQSRDCKSAII